MDYSMLTQDLNEDTFLPSSTAGLANIFGLSSTPSTSHSLMFNPPKPPEMLKMTDEYKLDNSQSSVQGQNKHSECILGKAVHAYHLVCGTYESKGKLGFAIIKMFHPAHVKMVIFNATKVTLASALLSDNLQVTINNNYLTFYDDSGQNWSILFSDNEMSHVVVELKNHQVKIINRAEHIELNSKLHGKPVTTISNVMDEESIIKDKTNDVESEVNVTKENDVVIKNINFTEDKTSLINRIAAMGQAILPRQSILPQTHSEFLDCKSTEHSQIDVGMIHGTKEGNPTHTPPSFHLHNVNSSEQIVPITDINMYKPSLSHPDNLIDKELKVGVTTISNKVDIVLDKLWKIENSHNIYLGSQNNYKPDFTTEVYKKLLAEYEEKISIKDKYIASLQEELIKEKHKSLCIVSDVNIDSNDRFKVQITNNSKLDTSCQTDVCEESTDRKISKLKIDNKNLEDRVHMLHADLENVQLKYEETYKELTHAKDELVKKEHNKFESIKDVKEVSTQYKNVFFDSEIKEIMNNTYQAVSNRFDDNEAYSTDSIRSILASVMRQTTRDLLRKT